MIFTIFVLLMLIGSILLISEKFTEKSPEFKQVVEATKKIHPYIGIVLVVVGIIYFIKWLIDFFRFLDIVDFEILLLFLIAILTCLIAILVGFLLSAVMAKSYKQLPEEKINQIENRISPFRIPIGGAGIVLFVIWLIVEVF